eukprot:Opistho-2@90957
MCTKLTPPSTRERPPQNQSRKCTRTRTRPRTEKRRKEERTGHAMTERAQVSSRRRPMATPSPLPGGRVSTDGEGWLGAAHSGEAIAHTHGRYQRSSFVVDLVPVHIRATIHRAMTRTQAPETARAHTRVLHLSVNRIRDVHTGGHRMPMTAQSVRASLRCCIHATKCEIQICLQTHTASLLWSIHSRGNPGECHTTTPTTAHNQQSPGAAHTSGRCQRKQEHVTSQRNHESPHSRHASPFPQGATPTRAWIRIGKLACHTRPHGCQNKWRGAWGHTRPHGGCPVCHVSRNGGRRTGLSPGSLARAHPGARAPESARVHARAHGHAPCPCRHGDATAPLGAPCQAHTSAACLRGRHSALHAACPCRRGGRCGALTQSRARRVRR